MSQYQLPPFKDDTLFEEFACDLFNNMAATVKSGNNDYQLFGVKGQKQKGIDIFSTKNSTGIQCKVKDLRRSADVIRKELKEEMVSDMKKTVELKLQLTQVKFVSTFRNDVDLQEYAHKLKWEMNLPFDVYYWGWDELSRFAEDSEVIMKKYFSHANDKKNDDEPEFGFDSMPNITSGKQLVELMCNVDAYAFQHDEVETEEEADILAAFFENLEDYGDLMGMGKYGKPEQVKLGLSWNGELAQLEGIGFRVFGVRRSQPVPEEYGKKLGDWVVANVYVIRQSNPMIVNFGELFNKEPTKE